MSTAANAVSDLAAPPPPRASAHANDDQNDGPSFQDHIDANDRTDRPDRPDPRPDRSERPQSSSDTRPQTSGPQSAQTQPAAQNKDTSASDETQDAHADAASAQTDTVQPPIFLQLIAHLVAPAAGAATAQQNQAAQQDAAATTQQTQANTAQAATTATVATPAPAKPTQKQDGNARPTHTKAAKGAAAKTDATPTADAAKTAAAPEALTAASQVQTSATVAAPVVATADAPKSDANAKPDAIEGAQAASARAGQPQQAQPQQTAPKQAAPQSPQHRQAPASTTSAPPAVAPETPPQTDASNAKARDTAKALTQADAVKQASQDFVAADLRVQASVPASPTSTPSATIHTPLVTSVEQAASSANTDARTQSAPVAAQIGGEIVRRFNGQDTSFQMRLDPPDLGRVDIRLDVSRDHRVTAVISADNPQALSDLSRGAKELQQALQSSGLNLADDGLRFDLSSGGQGNNFAQADQSGNRGGLTHAPNAQTQTPETPVSRPLRIDSWRGSRIDLVA